MPISKIKLNSTDNLFQNTEFNGTSHIRVPNGTEAQRPGSGATGMLRFNTTNSVLEQYGSDGWVGIEPAPTISSVTLPGSQTAVLDGDTITINGSGFKSGVIAKVQSVSTSVITNCDSTTRVSSSQLTATIPSGLAEGTYNVIVVNPSGLGATYENAFGVDGLPSWTTASGSLGNFMEQTAMTTTVEATEDGAAVTTFAVQSGSLPTGVTLNTSTGVISGTPAAVAGGTTYSFTIRATDSEGQYTDRSFTLYVENNNAPVWITSAGSIASILNNAAMSPVTLSAEDGDAGYSQTMSYSVTSGSLPTGLSLNSSTGVISGTPTGYTTDTTVTFTVTASDGIDGTTREFSIGIVTPDQYIGYVNSLITATAAEQTFTTASYNLDGTSGTFTISSADVQPSLHSPFSQNGWSVEFDRTQNSFFDVQHDTRYDLTGDFTAECWLKFNSLVGVGGASIPWNSYPIDSAQLYFTPSDGTITTVGFYFGGSSTLSASYAPPVGKWIHFAIARSGSTISMFIDGSRVATATNSTSVSSITGWRFGSQTAGNHDYDGSVSNFRLVNGSSVYDASQTTITVPTSQLTAVSNTVLLTCNSAKIKDNSSFNQAVTVDANPRVVPNSPFSTNTTLSNRSYGSADLAGSNKFSFNPSTFTGISSLSDFTVEGWIYNKSFAEVSPFFQRVFSVGDYNGQAGTMLYVNSSDGALYYYSGNAARINSSARKLYQWDHFALVRSSGTQTLYLNGVSQGTYSENTAKTLNDTFYIGYEVNDGQEGGNFNGLISNFRVSRVARYTSAFTPSTSPLSNDADTVFLTANNGKANRSLHSIVDKGVSKLRTSRYNTVFESSFTPHIPQNWGAYFLSNQGYFLPSSAAATIGSRSFTLEAWVWRDPNPNSDSVNYVADTRTNDGNGLFFYYNPSNSSWVSGQGTDQAFSNSTLSNNAWHHIAFVGTGSQVHFYMDGTYRSSINVSYNVTGDKISIGTRYTLANRWCGYISNFRMVHETQVYTGNTTYNVPTEPLTAISGTALLTLQDGMLKDNSSLNYYGWAADNAWPSIVPFSPFTSDGAYDEDTHGKSLYLEGTSDYVLVEPTPTLSPVNKDFTVELWWYPEKNGRQALFHGSWGTDWSWGMDFNGAGTGTIGIWASSSGTGWDMFHADSGGAGVGSQVIRMRSWNHIVYQRSGNTFNSWINGKLDRSITSSATIIDRRTSSFAVGVWWATGSMDTASGNISDFTVLKGTAKYTAGANSITVPSAPISATTNTSLMLPASASQYVDAVGKSNAGTISTTYTTTDTAKYGDGAIYFPGGTGNYIYMGSRPDLLINGTNDFTIEAWIKYNALPTGTYGFPLYAQDSMQAVVSPFNILQTGNTWKLFASSDNSTWAYNSTTLATTSLTTGQWYHIAVVRYNDTLKLYVDGTVAGTVNSFTINLKRDPYNRFVNLFGNWQSEGGGTGLNGYVSDYRITKYARYTANFTPPTAALKKF